MAKTTKPMSEQDGDQTLRGAYNEVDKSLTTAGFVVGKIGHKIIKTNVNAITEDFAYSDSSVALYTIRVIYTDATKADLVSVERIA